MTARKGLLLVSTEVLDSNSSSRWVQDDPLHSRTLSSFSLAKSPLLVTVLVTHPRTRLVRLLGSSGDVSTKSHQPGWLPRTLVWTSAPLFASKSPPCVVQPLLPL